MTVYSGNLACAGRLCKTKTDWLYLVIKLQPATRGTTQPAGRCCTTGYQSGGNASPRQTEQIANRWQKSNFSYLWCRAVDCCAPWCESARPPPPASCSLTLDWQLCERSGGSRPRLYVATLKADTTNQAQPKHLLNKSNKYQKRTAVQCSGDWNN